MLAKRDERILEPLPKAGALGTGCVGRDLRILTTLNPERGLWVDRGEGEKKVQCWEREVNRSTEAQLKCIPVCSWLCPSPEDPEFWNW